jgi:hypothetical protein
MRASGDTYTLTSSLKRFQRIEAERIVLIHVSARHSSKDVREIIEARVPEHLKPKLVLFPRPI